MNSQTLKTHVSHDFFLQIKEHAIALGDCVCVYDCIADKIVEYTYCFEDILGISPMARGIGAKWLANMKSQDPSLKQQVLSFNNSSILQSFEYEVQSNDGVVHYIRQVNYPYIDVADTQTELLLIVLRDCSHEYKVNPLKTTKDWRKEHSSQIRYMRPIVAHIHHQCESDFTMLAVPDEEKNSAYSLVAIQGDCFLDTIDYELKGTPCEVTSDGHICTHKKDITERYPEDEMLVNMGAQSYIGVPFFDNNGQVSAYLVIIKKVPLQNFDECRQIIDSFQPQLNRRIQLYFSDQRLAWLGNNKGSFLSFDQQQFALGTAPSTKELASWSSISEQTFNSIKEAVLISDANNKIIHCNKAFTDITGYTLNEVLGKDPGILSSGYHDATFYQKMGQSLQDNGFWEGEIINKNKAGKTYSEWLLIRVVYDENQQRTHYIAVFSDISKHKEKEELLYFQANYDPLTMLPNKSLLFFTLAEVLAKLQENSENLICLMHIDISGLARINENFDYYMGDAVLVETAKRIKEVVNNDDVMLARISGDNFILLYPEIDGETDVIPIADQICQNIALPMQIDDVALSIKSNVGLAVTSNSDLTPEALCSMTELALFNAKMSGANKVSMFDEQQQSVLKDNWCLEQDLAVAISEDQFELHYQPQIDRVSGKVIGVEALVRWQHPDKGLLSPHYFIHLAEQSEQIIELGNLVLSKACQQIKLWNSQLEEPITVSVNISPRQFAQECSTDTMANIITESGVDYSCVILEITEDMLMADHSDLLETLNNLKAMGLQLSLDDFGTGFSSLSYLQQYPLSELKIDRSFVKNISNNPESLSIVKAIVSMANSLSLKVVAEGVETAEQMNILDNLGCDIFQGYYYAEPMKSERLVEFIQQRNINL
ncbi:putative bifunctional diguanylate cyclase/phosphodiesterase [Thalassotalea aquiviva]|uniref:putative bifunctional diguanylate cyclase/phosphodiesterase n=1 Tax=Thalassotalea aquiviva TaxID=3242415 RepID=UPI00352B85EB